MRSIDPTRDVKEFCLPMAEGGEVRRRASDGARGAKGAPRAWLGLKEPLLQTLAPRPNPNRVGNGHRERTRAAGNELTNALPPSPRDLRALVLGVLIKLLH